MKTTTHSYTLALEQALRQALGTSQPALREQALDRAARYLIHPRMILDSPLLTDSHPWRKEALVVADAFEAVTNGMEEPGVLEALDDLEASSPFQPWRHLILALHFFYEGLDEAVGARLDQIPPASPVSALARAVRALVDPARAGSLSGALTRLSEQVAQTDPLVHQWVQDLSEGLETDHEELFWGALADWLDAADEQAPEQARSAVLWAWAQLEWRDFDERMLLDLGAGLWGVAESCRLAAIGTLSWDAEGAALLWLRFLVAAAREGALDEATIGEARSLLEDFRRAAESAAPPASEWQETWDNLALAWNTEAGLRGWTAWRLGVGPVEQSPLPRPALDGQLDLFA